MYHKEHTEAIVLGGIDVGETDRLIFLFTETRGRINVLAKNIKSPQSKMRMAMADYSLARVDIVEGKKNNILSGAIFIDSFYYDFEKSIFPKVLGMLRNLYQGSDPNKKIFDTMVFALEYLKQNEQHKKEVEVILVILILSELGYMADYENILKFDFVNNWENFERNQKIFDFIILNKKEIVFKITQSLRETGL